MKTTGAVIWYNIILFFVGTAGLYMLLWSTEKSFERGTQSSELAFEEFGKHFDDSALDDSLKTSSNLLYTYNIYKRIPVQGDSFLIKFKKLDTIPTYKLDNDTIKSTLEILKTKSDNDILRRGAELYPQQEFKVSYISVILAMGLAGLLGGILANLRGFFEFFREKKEFPENLFIPYYIRPITASLCGIFAFFLASVIASTTVTVENSIFVSFKSMISFLGFAILAGFASQEFTERLKSAASIMFGLNLDEHQQAPTPAPVQPSQPTPGAPDAPVVPATEMAVPPSGGGQVVPPVVSQPVPPPPAPRTKMINRD